MNSIASVGKSPANRRKNVDLRVIALGAAVVFVFALSVRIINFQHEPITDELYHLLAAESWVNDGSLSIADGEYRRASAFTKIIGVVYSVSNGNIDAIRIFCILIGSLLIAAVYAWTRRHTGAVDAAIAALLFALMPGAIFLSQHIRFYSLHALIFFLLAVGTYATMTNPMSLARRLGIFSALTLLTLLGVHLQVTTLVGLGGIFVWIVVFHNSAILDWLRAGRFRTTGIVAASTMLVAAVVLGRDILTVPPLEIQDIAVLRTMRGGQFVYVNPDLD